MINPFDIAKNFQKVQQQSKKLQQRLQQEQITVEHNGVVIVMRGDQQILSITVDGVEEPRIAEAINKAVQETQKLAAKKLIEISQEEANQ